MSNLTRGLHLQVSKLMYPKNLVQWQAYFDTGSRRFTLNAAALAELTEPELNEPE